VTIDMFEYVTTRRVLIVDDERSVGVAVAAALHGLAQCDTVDDAQTAVDALRTNHYDVALIDIGLPGMSGLALLDDMRRDFPRTVPVVISANDDLQVAQNAIARGAFGYVVKPFRVNDLRIQLMSALARAERSGSRIEPNGRLAIAEHLDRVTPRDGAFACVVVDLEQFQQYRAIFGRSRAAVEQTRLERRLIDADPTIEIVGTLENGSIITVVALDGRTPADIGKTLGAALCSDAGPDESACLRPVVGVSIASTDARNGMTLLEQAEAAAAAARDRLGGHVAVYNDELSAAARRDLELLGDSRRAIATGQIQLVYQPQVEVATGRWIGLEALARWHHPERGVVSPDVFVPMLERSGLICDLGAFVLGQACRDLARLRVLTGTSVPRLSVNVSPLQVDDPNFAAVVTTALEDSGLAPGCLCLELTESHLLDESRALRARLHTLSRRGVRLSIDDFGVGYSTFSYLTDLPWNELKIDRSLTQQCHQAAGQEVLRSIFGLSRALHLDVIVEGIETDAELVVLRDLGCRYAQGFLWSRPLTIADVAQQMRAKHAVARAYGRRLADAEH
jgi:EAL domain-containing protein (putative c-di-GMP-specific phosphodiesterase class I)/DNA-binding response OmpR family regulator